VPDLLPDSKSANPHFDEIANRLQPLLEQDNPYAFQLSRYLSPPGQSFLATVNRVVDKAASQDTIVSLFESITDYNKKLPLAVNKQRTFEEAQRLADEWLQALEEEPLRQCVESCSEHLEKIRAMLILAQMGEVTLFPIFGLTDALGSVMRKKLKPLTDPLQQQIAILMS
jgi:hypothetical protein